MWWGDPLRCTEKYIEERRRVLTQQTSGQTRAQMGDQGTAAPLSSLWEMLDDQKAARLRTDGVDLAYLSTAIRSWLFRQEKNDLYLKEVEVT